MALPSVLRIDPAPTTPVAFSRSDVPQTPIMLVASPRLHPSRLRLIVR